MLCLGKTDIGKRRNVNQDSFLCTELDGRAMLAVVCDGMGGAAGGGVAGSLACDVFSSAMQNSFPDFSKKSELSYADEKKITVLLRQAVSAANEAVYEKAAADLSLRGMGTTLVATLHCANTLFTVNVGDSRMYLISDDSIRQITHDHSYVQYLVDSGRMSETDARKSINRNIITRAVGTDKSVDADTFITHIDPDSDYLVLLCSDGLTNHVTPDKIFEAVSCEDVKPTEKSLTNRLDALIAQANASGGTDNITAVLMAI